MATLVVHVDQDTHARLRVLSERLGRTVEDLLDCSVAEAALAGVKQHGMLTEEVAAMRKVIAREYERADKALDLVASRMTGPRN